MASGLPNIAPALFPTMSSTAAPTNITITAETIHDGFDFVAAWLGPEYLGEAGGGDFDGDGGTFAFGT